MTNLILIGIVGVLVASFGQVALKVGALKKKDASILLFFLNIYTFVGYISLFIVTLINLFIFKYLDLKYILIFLPSTYILVLLLSYFILNEHISKKNIISYITILIGIIIFNL